MVIFQLGLFCFGLYMLFWVFLVYKKRIIFVNELIVWSLIWLFFLASILFPDLLEKITYRLGVVRVLDLIMVLSFVALWITSYKNYVDNQQIKKKFSDFVRQEAIKGSD